MLTPEEYKLAWAIYGAASVVVVICFWGLTRWVPTRPLRLLLRGLVAIVLLTPVDVPPNDTEWAPAVAASFFGVVAQENWLPLVGPSYVFALVGLLVLVVLDALIFGVLDKKAK